MKQKLLGVSAMGLCLLSGPNLSYAFNPQPDPPAHIGMVGIVSDQTLRLNVRARMLVRTDVPPGPCRVVLGFADANGATVGDRVSRVLLPGQASFLDLSGQAFGTTDPAARMEFHPVVRVSANPSLIPPCTGVAATAEVFDVTGRTSVLVEDPNEFTIEDPDL